jgi:hypothetical protein
MPTIDPIVAEYRYFVADFLTNAVIAELPFTGVSYERALKTAGSFSGSIPVIDKTAAYSLYDNTMPGRTSLYVVRNGECVWGGIIWSRSYSVIDRNLSVTATEFTSYFYHRNIWKTYTHNLGATLVASGGTASVTLESATFAFAAGMPVRVSFSEVGDFQYTANYTILTSPAPTSTTFSVSIPTLPNGTYTNTTIYVRVDTYDYTRRLIEAALSDFKDIDFPNDEIEPGSQTNYNVTNKVLTSNVATLTVSESHDAMPGQDVLVENLGAPFDGSHTVTSATDTTISYAKTATNVASAATSAVSRSVTNRQLIGQIAVLTTSASHGFTAGQVVVISGVDSSSQTSIVYDGTFYIEAVPSSTTFSYIISGAIDSESVACSGTAIVTPSAWISTFGPFPANADFGLEFSTSEYSGVSIDTFDKNRRGFELKSIGDELSEYSDSLSGFEYRIDCEYDTATSAFKRTFVVLPVNFPNPPPAGEASPITRFGAQNLVFEYPGNIMDASLDESAEDAATRFFVVGNDGDLGEDASQPYSVASAIDLLAQGWPLLDQEETMSTETAKKITNSNDPANIYDEDTLYSYAQRYLSEFRPPVSDLKLSVNGSLSPKIGTYSPGDWCCLIFNDDFIKLRLASNLEPRSDLLVRKIESYKVDVPDNPSFPEKVELNLITEWEVDQIGQ